MWCLFKVSHIVHWCLLVFVLPLGNIVLAGLDPLDQDTACLWFGHQSAKAVLNLTTAEVTVNALAGRSATFGRIDIIVALIIILAAGTSLKAWISLLLYSSSLLLTPD